MQSTDTAHTGSNTSRSLWASIVYFFPIQLLILHAKRNHLLTVFWLLLFGYVSGTLASKYGVHYLFLYPEYLGEVGFMSHFMIGFATGGFIMAFNIYSYVTHAFRFPFLATLARPFYKFCLNNFIIPTAFISYYIWKAVQFQLNIELETAWGIFQDIGGFLTGVMIFLIISLGYFSGTNKDVFGFLKNKDRKRGRFASLYQRFMIERSKQSERDYRARPWRVETYLRGFTSIGVARGSEHYDAATLQRVFRQNHFNASLFELLLVISFLLVMNFGEVPLFTIPGGASVILGFTLLLMLLSMLLSWFRGWAVTVIIVLVALANSFSNDLSFLPKQNALYGMDYTGPQMLYGSDQLDLLQGDSNRIDHDRAQMEAVLDRWAAKQGPTETGKPKMLLINVSGGGLRSALWVTTVLSELDERLGGDLMDRTVLMTGASGGMIGANHVRDSYMANDLKNIYELAPEMKTDIGRDVLDPVLLSIASTDILFNLARFEYNGFEYPKDRAYRFEERLIANTGGHFTRTLKDYREAEAKADVPMVMLYSTIINDGRKLLASPLDIAFMCQLPGNRDPYIDHQHEFVEYRRLLAPAGADDVRMSSLIRANATFPYILPQVSLPTEPPIQLMDAGLRDNYGYTVSFRFVATMHEWIEANTSGVVVLQIRDKQKKIANTRSSQSLLARMTSPVGNIYANFLKTQDFTHDEQYNALQRWLQVPIEQITMQMEQEDSKDVSMSWHLTALEKVVVEQSISAPRNEAAMGQLLQLLEHNGLMKHPD